MNSSGQAGSNVAAAARRRQANRPSLTSCAWRPPSPRNPVGSVSQNIVLRNYLQAQTRLSNRSACSRPRTASGAFPNIVTQHHPDGLIQDPHDPLTRSIINLSILLLRAHRLLLDPKPPKRKDSGEVIKNRRASRGTMSNTAVVRSSERLR